MQSRTKLLYVGIICTIGFGLFAGFMIEGAIDQSTRAEFEGSDELFEEARLADVQLYAEIVAVQKLAFSRLATADDATKTTVAELLVEASKSLGNPTVSSRLVVSSASYVHEWNKEGLALTARAREVIDKSAVER